MNRPKGYMDLNLFKKICEEASKYDCRGVRFLRWGEPFLHPNFIDFIKIAKEYELLTHVTTNGYQLDETTDKEVVLAGLDSIIISMQGTNEEEYSKLRSGSYAELKHKIEELYKIRVSLGCSNPFITISTTLTNESQEDLDEFKYVWKDIADDVSVGYTWFKRLKDKSKVQDLISRSQKLVHKFKCQEVMIKLSIDWDGVVSPCCLDYNQQLSVGKFPERSLISLWNSAEVQAIRNLLTRKQQDLFVLCSTCELNYSFRGEE